MRGGRKDNPCSCSHAVKKNSSMKNSFDIFFKRDTSTVFWNRAPNEFMRFAAKPRGYKSFYKMVFSPLEVKVQAMVGTPKWLGHITEDILICCIIPDILPPSKFYTEELRRAFQQHQSKQFSAFSICLHLDSALHHFQYEVYSPISVSYIEYHVFQHTP